MYLLLILLQVLILLQTKNDMTVYGGLFLLLTSVVVMKVLTAVKSNVHSNRSPWTT